VNENTLREWYLSGQRSFPDVTLGEEAFFRYLREREPDGEAHAADLYLACACALGQPLALARFEELHLSALPRFLAGVERTPAALDEIRQLLRERLFVGARPKIGEYSGLGSLQSWLRVVALRVAHNRRRALRPKAEQDGAADAPEVLPAVDPELALIRARGKAQFKQALAEAFKGLTPRDRVIFRMHYLDGLNIDGIGVVFNVHRATVARWIAAACEGLLERTLAQMNDTLRLHPREFESLLKAVRSSLDISLRALLAADAG
jgi:RNA polymerase sigma-70 factor (ECF subfamily)